MVQHFDGERHDEKIDAADEDEAVGADEDERSDEEEGVFHEPVLVFQELSGVGSKHHITSHIATSHTLTHHDMSSNTMLIHVMHHITHLYTDVLAPTSPKKGENRRCR